MEKELMHSHPIEISSSANKLYNGKLREFPFKAYLSLESLVEFLEKERGNGNPLKREFLKIFSSNIIYALNFMDI